MTIYKGFSTYNSLRKFTLTDFDLVKQDLYNHFNIRRGEKLMNPEFGTEIWAALFEPLTPALKDALVTDIKRVAAYDPRVAVDNIVLSEYEHGLMIELELTYLTDDLTETISLTFDRNSSTIATGRI